MFGAADHFLRGAPGEGEQENVVRSHAAFQKTGDTRGECLGFPRAGAGDYQQRPVPVRGGSALLRVQFGKPRRCRHDFLSAALANGDALRPASGPVRLPGIPVKYAPLAFLRAHRLDVFLKHEINHGVAYAVFMKVLNLDSRKPISGVRGFDAPDDLAVRSVRLG